MEPITSFDRYSEAKIRVRELRAAQERGDASVMRVIYASEAAEAERLLREKREAPPLGDE